ncbi:hypothetical protein LCGC14_1352080 [marine sediment metagenome]|uniref:RecF/RecN/SMC N-terminal domain-containing protein n=1 Tax=marine sediment metagenome TaxID=412755 RepID=A0A0F9MR83_9ZZZZ
MNGDFERIKNRAIEITAERGVLRQNTLKHQKSLEMMTQRKIDAEKARIIIKETAHETQENLEIEISDLVSTLLLAVLDTDIPEFYTKFVDRRNVMECDLKFKRGEVLYNPLESGGGGAANIGDIGLQVACWSLDKNRPVFLWDQPFRDVSHDLQSKTSEMVKMLCDELNIQIIMVSAEPDIYEKADKVFHVEKINKRSIIKEQ